ncbi:amino acid ABC transporter substrate-binding protein [Paracandidimonas soli]|uniref:amino acid ABC transporter substrate-binding protein n=1 Tax=Paracandidimonas soli TaxID=1917182 RepID=UPI00333EAE25
MNIKAICRFTSSLAGLLIAANAHAGPTLDAVKARGELICAVNGSRPGLSAVDSKGVWSGLDVDSCRAVAAAVLGDASKVRYVKTTTQTRLTVLQTGDVDMTAANTTWTMSRDVTTGLDFTPTTFYDGQGFMVNKSLGVSSVQELDGATVCVRPGSTSEEVATDIARKFNLNFKMIVIADQKEMNTAFFGGRCDVAVQSTAGLAANRAAAASNPDEWVILPGVFGKDPEGPIVRQGDPEWKDIVSWATYAMFEAEELDVNSRNVDEKRKESDSNIQRLLGVKGGLGSKLGLDDEWAYRIIKQVGNYAESFDRNLGKDSSFKLERGLNALWKDGGLLYSPPFN